MIDRTNSPDQAETHYVAHVKIMRVSRVPSGTGLPALSKSHERAQTELAVLTVKSVDLKSLKARLAMHVDLIDDVEGITDPTTEKTSRR